MTRREIFYCVSLACLGIFILVAAYMWGESRAQSKEIIFNKDSYSRQAEETANPVKSQPANSVSAATNPTVAASSTPASIPATTLTPAVVATPLTTENPGNAQASSANPAPTVTAKNNYFVATGTKVGEIVKIGDVEMIVTKSTARHKVIDITLKGNTSDQPPRLVLTENNRIVYEIPADVDVNMDVTEKTVVDKSPVFSGQ
ncbi:hypothetical protein [Pelotomaculum propionicicum]|uniref:Uncharacterized protein n=1 Tax=Pelotomaculum propionicicum TaxID=258475 RepID=A0A4Y7RKL2_9FIRM|nr:hypothetical protein [Pelotomaculum propionicicum]TEB09524.1 hypothetical protein Pmgp_03069 [Pelotomaculum propionicicum]